MKADLTLDGISPGPPDPDCRVVIHARSQDAYMTIKPYGQRTAHVVTLSEVASWVLRSAQWGEED